MTMSLTCSQVSALLSFYINDKLNDQLKQFVKSHLDVCPTCRAKYEALKKMVTSLKQAHERIDGMDKEKVKNPFGTDQFNEFQKNLSAYVDNELTDEENIKVKKYAISNPEARKNLEEIYNFRRLLHNSFEKARTEIKDDFSKYIMSQMDFEDEIYSLDPLVKAVSMFILITAFVVLGAVMIFWI